MPVVARAADQMQVGLIDSITDILLRLPQEKGWYAEQGLEVAFTPFDSAAKMVAPLAAGQLDAGSGAISAGLFNAVGRGLDVRIVADKGRNGAQFPWEALLIRKDLLDGGAVSSLADLKGRRIAVAAPGISTLSFLNQLAGHAGIPVESIGIEYLGFAQLAAALQNHAIDGAVGIEPYTTGIVRGGFAERFGNPHDFAPNAEGSVLLYGPSLLTTRRDVGRRFMKVYVRAAAYYMSAIEAGRLAGPRGEEIIAAMAEFMHAEPALVREMYPFAIGDGAHLDLASLGKDFDFFVAHKLIDTKVTLPDAIDETFLP